MRISVLLHRQGLCTAVHVDSRLPGAPKVHEHCTEVPTARHCLTAFLYTKHTHVDVQGMLLASCKHSRAERNWFITLTAR